MIKRSFESIVGLLDEDGRRVLTRRETRTLPANYFVRDLRAGTEQAATQFADPHPQLTKAMADRMFVTYKRKDGVGLSGTIYLPVGYQKGQRVPMLLWAYPQEFVDSDAAGQVVGSFAFANAVGAAAQGRMMDRLGQPRVLASAAAIHAVALVGLVVKNHDLEATTLPISMSWMYAPLVLAGAATAIQGAVDLAGAVRARKVAAAADVPEVE